MTKVAALYVDPRGPYFGRDDVDPWPLERNALLYDDLLPVVAHPDCGPWSKLRHMCTKQNRECAPAAVVQVRSRGGVLEHPAHSDLWRHCELFHPGLGAAIDGFGGRSFELDQCDWGHKCRKPTWIYVVASYEVHDWVLDQIEQHRGTGTPTHCVCTGPRQKERLPVATKLVKRITPPAFAELLISIARSAGKESRCA